MKTCNKGLMGVGIALALVVTALLCFTKIKAHQLITNPVALRRLPTRTPADLRLRFKDVIITNSDGLRLVGWYIPSLNRAAILAQHGYKMCRDEMLPAAGVLARHGYGVLICSVRAHDLSEGDQLSFGAREIRDLEAWYQFLATRPDVDPDRVGALGNSMGGSLVIQLAAHHSGIRAVAADSPFSSLDDTIVTSVRHYTGLPRFPFASLIFFWAKVETGCNLSQINAKIWIKQLSPRPVLLMQGGADTTVSRHSGEELFAAAAGPKELWFEPLIGHANFATNAPAYENKLAEFFDRSLTAR